MRKPYRLSRKDLTRLLGLRSIVRAIGGGLLLLPLIFLFPFTRLNGPTGYEPGAKMARAFSLMVLFDSNLGIGVLVLAGIGFLLVIASFFVHEY